METLEQCERLQTSPGVEITSPEPGRYVAIQERTARQYSVGQKIVDLLQALRFPQTLQEIRDGVLATCSEQEVDQVVNFLRRHQLIHIESAEPIYQVRKQTYSLFGIDGVELEAIQPNWRVSVGVPYGHGNGTDHRCWLFPSNLRTYLKSRDVKLTSRQQRSVSFQFIDRNIDFSSLQRSVEDKTIRDWGDLFIGSHEYPTVVYQKIHEVASDLFRRRAIPFFLGGDHSISLPIIRAASQFHEQLQIIQLDAHTDTYDGTVQRQWTHHHGNFMAEVLKLDNVSRVVQLGIRGLSNINAKTYNSPKQVIYWAEEVREMLHTGERFDIDPLLPTYVTFDIDCFDPTLAPATATPVFNGFTYHDVNRLLSTILPGLPIVGMDLVEVNPKLDQDTRTMELATHVILLLLNYAQNEHDTHRSRVSESAAVA